MLNEPQHCVRIYPIVLFENINRFPRDLAEQLIASIEMASIGSGFLLRIVTHYLLKVMAFVSF
jgi:hypothetical protein